MIVNSKLEPLFLWLHYVFFWSLLFFIGYTIPVFLGWLYLRFGNDDRPLLQILCYLFLPPLGMGLIAGTLSWKDAKRDADWVE
jgi:hypothetical protein